MTLFENLPQFPLRLDDDELKILAMLPDSPTMQELEWGEWRTAGRLERKGLIKISRSCQVWWAGKLATAKLREVIPDPSP